MLFYWPPTVLPPYSLNLNQLDYIVYGVLQERIKATAHPDAKMLK